MNSRELCLEQACELTGACELARVKLSGLYCIFVICISKHTLLVNPKGAKCEIEKNHNFMNINHGKIIASFAYLA